MQLQLIRNATLRMTYGGKRFLIDPYLADKHTLPSYRGVSPNPTVDLPCRAEEVMDGAEVVVISHLHADHFDPTAQQMLPKDLPIFCQPGDESAIESKGFGHVVPVDDVVNWEGVTMTRTPAQHGSGHVLALMGNASGFVFQAEGEPTVYWAGDTIWYEDVAGVIARVQPDVIITHSCGAVWDDVLIVMDGAQTLSVCRAAPEALVIATHMEALDHATVSRVDLRALAEQEGVSSDQLRIPADGEFI